MFVDVRSCRDVMPVVFVTLVVVRKLSSNCVLNLHAFGNWRLFSRVECDRKIEKTTYL